MSLSERAASQLIFLCETLGLKRKKKKQITALEKYVPQNPLLVSKGLSEGYFDNETLVYK